MAVECFALTGRMSGHCLGTFETEDKSFLPLLPPILVSLTTTHFSLYIYIFFFFSVTELEIHRQQKLNQEAAYAELFQVVVICCGCNLRANKSCNQSESTYILHVNCLHP
jgi:hypothetical protein